MCRTIASIVSVALALICFSISAFGQSHAITQPLRQKPSPTIVHGPPLPARISAIAGGTELPVWNYQVVSSRDGNLYQGVIVGRDPDT